VSIVRWNLKEAAGTSLTGAMAIGGFFKGIADFADKVEGFFSSEGILYKILSFGAEKW
jgi:hypothetical protein